MKGHVIFESRAATRGFSMPFARSDIMSCTPCTNLTQENINLNLIPDRLLVQTAICLYVDQQDRHDAKS